MTLFKRPSTILVCVLFGTINGDITQNTRVIEEGTCQNGNLCIVELDEADNGHEKYKYHTELQHAVEIFKDTVDATREPSEEELRIILHEMNVKEPDEDMGDYDIPEDLEGEAKTEEINDGSNIEIDQEAKKDFEFPKLVKVEPGNVGDVKIFEVDTEHFYKRITMSVRPTIFGMFFFVLFCFYNHY